MMAEEKVAPPSYSFPTVMQSEPKKSSKKWLWGVVFYAGAVTAALIVVSVLGSVYIKDIKATYRPQQEDTQDEGEPHENKHYHDSNEESKQDVDFDLDLTADKEVIRFTNQETGTSSIAVLDFQKDLAAMYDSRTDECYLIGGIDSRLPDAGQLDELLQKERKETQDDEVKIDYVVNRERQVKKLDLLPSELLSHCWGKNVYWLEKTQDTTGREKRLTCDYYLYCVNGKCYILRVCY